MKLDRTDLRILSTLQREGRITKTALAERVNLSPTPCWERMRRLEQGGVITGYHARVDLDRLAPHTLVVMEVTLATHRQEDFERFETAVQHTPEIVECWATGGGVDYVMKVLTRDVPAYQSLVETLLAAELGIDRYFSYVVTKPVKSTPSLPIDRLFDTQER